MKVIDLPVDPESPFYEDFKVVVPYITDTYAYPYISLITGPHSKYRLERHFLRRVRPEWHDFSWVYRYLLPLTGVYEVGIKRWDCDTRELLSREVSYHLFDGENVTDLSRETVMERFAKPTAQIS